MHFLSGNASFLLRKVGSRDGRQGGRLMERMLIRTFLLAGIVAFNCLAQPFFLRKDILVGQHPSAVIAGDFNGDGKVDLAVSTADGLFVLLNAGNRNFQAPIRTDAPSGIFWMPAAADFNGDGKDDLVGSGSVFLSRGDGTFMPPVKIGDQEAVATADFNGDGKTDLLIADHYWSNGAVITHGVRVLLGNGDGTFRAGAKLTVTAAVQIRVADFNGDGRADVVMLPIPGIYPDLTGAGFTTLLVFLGRGDGTFSPVIRTTLQATSDAWSIVSFLVADFNGDKMPDLFTASGIMLGKGDGTFRAPVPYTTKLPGYPIAAADLTSDGFADVVMTDKENSIAIYPGKGDGTILPALEQRISSGLSYPYAAILVDLDADGRLDVIISNTAYSSISALLGEAKGPALQRAVSSAIDMAIVSPGSLATLFAGTSAVITEATPPWPTTLDGIILQVQDSTGWTYQAPLLYVSPTQVNFQVPADIAPGEAKLIIGSHSGPTEAGSMQVEAVAPAVFMLSSAGVPAATAVLVEPDGTQVSVPMFVCSPDLGCGFLPIPLSTAGDRPIYLSFFGTGFSGATADNVTCTINGVAVPVVFAGPHTTSGVDQVKIRLRPEVLNTLDLGWGETLATVTLRIGGQPANPFWIEIL
jgi:uncharacterized protein (TIGR03437 family)